MENSPSQQGWKKESGFVWAVLGSVVGFANVLSFSAQCYQNGGGAFLLPYLFAYLILGIPMLFLEGLIGQKWRLPFVSAYGKVFGHKGRMLGWMAVLGCLTIGAFYIVLTGYSALYAFFAATNQIPENTTHFFKESFLKSTQNLSDFGVFSWPIFLTVAALIGATWWILTKGVQKGIEKICSIFMPLLAVFVVCFAIVATFLPGAGDGIREYLTPHFSKLLSFSLWRDVFGQLFFSLSLGLGIITGYSQYNGKSINLKRAMIWVAIGDFAISFISGWLIFACIGYMSYTYHTPFESIVSTDSAFQIGFIIFPKIIQTFSSWLQPILGVIFFFSIFIAGITGVFSIIESVVGNIEREFKKSRKWAVTAALSVTLVASLFFCMGNGQLILGALAPMVLGINMIFGALIEIFVFTYFSKEISEDAIWRSKSGRPFAIYSLKYVVPSILGVILIGCIAQEFHNAQLGTLIRWGWFFIALGCAGFFASRSQFAVKTRPIETL